MSSLALMVLLTIAGLAYLAHEVAAPGTEVSLLGLVKYTKAMANAAPSVAQQAETSKVTARQEETALQAVTSKS